MYLVHIKESRLVISSFNLKDFQLENEKKLKEITLYYLELFFCISSLEMEYHLKDTYIFNWITELVINNYSSNKLESIRHLEHLEVLRLDNCDLDKVNMETWDFPMLDIVSLNNCNLATAPTFILKSYWIIEIHLENNRLKGISNKFVRFYRLHILNLIGNNLISFLLSPMVYSYYWIGIKYEPIDFIRKKKLIITLNESERELLC
jgi:hypothetical protein